MKEAGNKDCCVVFYCEYCGFGVRNAQNLIEFGKGCRRNYLRKSCFGVQVTLRMLSGRRLVVEFRHVVFRQSIA